MEDFTMLFSNEKEKAIFDTAEKYAADYVELKFDEMFTTLLEKMGQIQSCQSEIRYLNETIREDLRKRRWDAIRCSISLKRDEYKKISERINDIKEIMEARE